MVASSPRKTRRSETPPAPLPAHWQECVRGENITWENRRVRSELVCFGEVMYQPGGNCGPRQQRDYQLVFLHSGELVATVDGEERELTPGHVGLFLPGKNEVFHFSGAHPTHHSWCSVAPKLVPTDLRQLLERVARVQPCDEVQARLLAAGVALGQADSDVARTVVDQIGMALLGAYAKAGAQQAEVGVIHLAVRYMEQHLTEPECLQHVHTAVGVSRNTLISRFRSELGVTPARHLWRLRAERGIAMLAETGHTIAEIAYACGFGDQFHFSRLVKGLAGVSPRDLRQKLWAGDK